MSGDFTKDEIFELKIVALESRRKCKISKEELKLRKMINVYKNCLLNEISSGTTYSELMKGAKIKTIEDIVDLIDYAYVE